MYNWVRILIAFGAGALNAQVSVSPWTWSTDSVPGFDATGSIMLAVGRMKVDLTYPHGKKSRNETTVGYNPKTGHYFWQVSTSNSIGVDDTNIYVAGLQAGVVGAFDDASGLAEFGFGMYGKIWQGTAPNLDTAVNQSLAEIRQGVPDAEGRGFHSDFTMIPVFGRVRGFDVTVPVGFKPIGRDFTCDPRPSFCPDIGNKIVSIARQGKNYRLLLRNRYDVEVIVDQNLNIVSVTQLTQPPQ
jgi:hypothetical protein